MFLWLSAISSSSFVALRAKFPEPTGYRSAILNAVNEHTRSPVTSEPGRGTSLCDLNGDVRPDRVWFSRCFFLNGVSISLLSVLHRVSLHELMA